MALSFFWGGDRRREDTVIIIHSQFFLTLTHAIQFFFFPFKANNYLVRLLNRCRVGVSWLTGGAQAGCVRFDIFLSDVRGMRGSRIDRLIAWNDYRPFKDFIDRSLINRRRKTLCAWKVIVMLLMHKKANSINQEKRAWE